MKKVLKVSLFFLCFSFIFILSNNSFAEEGDTYSVTIENRDKMPDAVDKIVKALPYAGEVTDKTYLNGEQVKLNLNVGFVAGRERKIYVKIGDNKNLIKKIVFASGFSKTNFGNGVVGNIEFNNTISIKVPAGVSGSAHGELLVSLEPKPEKVIEDTFNTSMSYDDSKYSEKKNIGSIRVLSYFLYDVGVSTDSYGSIVVEKEPYYRGLGYNGLDTRHITLDVSNFPKGSEFYNNGSKLTQTDGKVKFDLVGPEDSIEVVLPKIDTESLRVDYHIDVDGSDALVPDLGNGKDKNFDTSTASFAGNSYRLSKGVYPNNNYSVYSYVKGFRIYIDARSNVDSYDYINSYNRLLSDNKFNSSYYNNNSVNFYYKSGLLFSGGIYIGKTGKYDIVLSKLDGVDLEKFFINNKEVSMPDSSGDKLIFHDVDLKEGNNTFLFFGNGTKQGSYTVEISLMKDNASLANNSKHFRLFDEGVNVDVYGPSVTNKILDPSKQAKEVINLSFSDSIDPRSIDFSDFLKENPGFSLDKVSDRSYTLTFEGKSLKENISLWLIKYAPLFGTKAKETRVDYNVTLTSGDKSSYAIGQFSDSIDSSNSLTSSINTTPYIDLGGKLNYNIQLLSSNSPFKQTVILPYIGDGKSEISRINSTNRSSLRLYDDGTLSSDYSSDKNMGRFGTTTSKGYKIKSIKFKDFSKDSKLIFSMSGHSDINLPIGSDGSVNISKIAGVVFKDDVAKLTITNPSSLGSDRMYGSNLDIEIEPVEAKRGDIYSMWLTEPSGVDGSYISEAKAPLGASVTINNSSISGNVRVDGEGSDLFTVVLAKSIGGDFVDQKEVRTEKDGSYSFTGLDSGVYKVYLKGLSRPRLGLDRVVVGSTPHGFDSSFTSKYGVRTPYNELYDNTADVVKYFTAKNSNSDSNFRFSFGKSNPSLSLDTSNTSEDKGSKVDGTFTTIVKNTGDTKIDGIKLNTQTNLENVKYELTHYRKGQIDGDIKEIREGFMSDGRDATLLYFVKTTSGLYMLDKGVLTKIADNVDNYANSSKFIIYNVGDKLYTFDLLNKKTKLIMSGHRYSDFRSYDGDSYLLIDKHLFGFDARDEIIAPYNLDRDDNTLYNKLMSFDFRNANDETFKNYYDTIFSYFKENPNSTGYPLFDTSIVDGTVIYYISYHKGFVGFVSYEAPYFRKLDISPGDLLSFNYRYKVLSKNGVYYSFDPNISNVENISEEAPANTVYGVMSNYVFTDNGIYLAETKYSSSSLEFKKVSSKVIRPLNVGSHYSNGLYFATSDGLYFINGNDPIKKIDSVTGNVLKIYADGKDINSTPLLVHTTDGYFLQSGYEGSFIKLDVPKDAIFEDPSDSVSTTLLGNNTSKYSYISDTDPAILFRKDNNLYVVYQDGSSAKVDYEGQLLSYDMYNVTRFHPIGYIRTTSGLYSLDPMFRDSGANTKFAKRYSRILYKVADVYEPVTETLDKDNLNVGKLDPGEEAKLVVTGSVKKGLKPKDGVLIATATSPTTPRSIYGEVRSYDKEELDNLYTKDFKVDNIKNNDTIDADDDLGDVSGFKVDKTNPVNVNIIITSKLLFPDGSERLVDNYEPTVLDVNEDRGYEGIPLDFRGNMTSVSLYPGEHTGRLEFPDKDNFYFKNYIDTLHRLLREHGVDTLTDSGLSSRLYIKGTDTPIDPNNFKFNIEEGKPLELELRIKPVIESKPLRVYSTLMSYASMKMSVRNSIDTDNFSSSDMELNGDIISNITLERIYNPQNSYYPIHNTGFTTLAKFDKSLYLGGVFSRDDSPYKIDIATIAKKVGDKYEVYSYSNTASDFVNSEGQPFTLAPGERAIEYYQISDNGSVFGPGDYFFKTLARFALDFDLDHNKAKSFSTIAKDAYPNLDILSDKDATLSYTPINVSTSIVPVNIIFDTRFMDGNKVVDVLRNNYNLGNLEAPSGYIFDTDIRNIRYGIRDWYDDEFNLRKDLTYKLIGYLSSYHGMDSDRGMEHYFSNIFSEFSKKFGHGMTMSRSNRDGDYENDLVLNVNIPVSKPIDLPNTGGSGLYIYILAVLSICLATAFIIKNKLKENISEK